MDAPSPRAAVSPDRPENGRGALPQGGELPVAPDARPGGRVDGGAPASVGTAGAGRGGRPARFAAFESRNFRLLWFGLLASNVGTWMASTAEGWLVTDLEPDRPAFALGLIAIAFAVPMLLLPPVGGAIADRVPRLRVLRTAQVVYIALNAATTLLILTDRANVWLLMGYAFLTGTVLAFDNPTRQALMPDLVDRAQLTSAISLNASVFTGAALVGPAAAGALIPLVGPGGVFAVNTLSYLAVLGALRRMSGVPERASRSGERGVLGTIASGVAYVRGTPTVATLLLLSLLTGLFGRSFGPLLAVFARDVFDVGSFPFGVMVAAPGLGTLVGSLWLAARGDVAAKGRRVLAATVGMSASLALFAVAPAYALALPLLLGAGLLGTVASALTATMLQLQAPPMLRGRVMSYYTLTLIGVPALGTLLLGAVADAVGVRAAVAGAAVLLAGLTVAVYRRGAGLREAD